MKGLRSCRVVPINLILIFFEGVRGGGRGEGVGVGGGGRGEGFGVGGGIKGAKVGFDYNCFLRAVVSKVRFFLPTYFN